MSPSLYITDILTSWPIFAIPEFSILYAFSGFAGRLGFREPELMLSSLPGILIALAWCPSEGISSDPGYIMGTLIIAPTNIVAALTFFYSIIRKFSKKRSQDNASLSKKVGFFLVGLLMLLYLLDQLVIVAANQAAD